MSDEFLIPLPRLQAAMRLVVRGFGSSQPVPDCFLSYCNVVVKIYKH